VSGPDYCAPAAKLFTAAHIRDPLVRAQEDAPGRMATVGTTVCGLEMILANLWQLLDFDPGGKVCEACASGKTISEEQGALI
jgi:hypothetical protein